MHFFRVHTRLSACARPSGCTCLHGRMLLLEGSPASWWRRALVSRMQSRDADGRHSSGLSRCLRAAWGGGKGSLRARGYQMVLQGQRFSPRWGVAHSGNAAWAAIRTEGGFLRGAGLGNPFCPPVAGQSPCEVPRRHTRRALQRKMGKAGLGRGCLCWRPESKARGVSP